MLITCSSLIQFLRDIHDFGVVLIKVFFLEDIEAKATLAYMMHNFLMIE